MKTAVMFYIVDRDTLSLTAQRTTMLKGKNCCVAMATHLAGLDRCGIRSPDRQPVASRYIDCAIPAQI